ncbi:MFS general substrate transporter [Suillus spraguei]|nr:MFS general substrate transporter [Suillus spraguei]
MATETLQPHRALIISNLHSELYPDPKFTHSHQRVTVEEPLKDDKEQLPVYRLYKRRFAGLFGFILLAIVTGTPWSWFGPISNEAAQAFDISIYQVNWLGNIVACVFLPVSLLVPIFCTRFGIRRCVEVGVVMLLISGWVRYAGTITSLSSESAYALLILGQSFSAISQPVFQILGPKYSEVWFDLKGRTTATMVIAVANPVGSAVGQLLSPCLILVLAIISTVVAPALFLIESKPPSPPTYAGSKAPQSLHSLLCAIVGKVRPDDPAYMTPHERLDFLIIFSIFGVLVGTANALSILSAQYFSPEGYSDTISGLFGATLLLSGIFASVITAPLFDRVLTHHLGITLRVLVPIAAGAWLSLIWAVKPNNTGGLFAIMAVIGICSFIMLPVGLELGAEVTRNSDGTEGALRASATASPPYNMHRAFVLHGVVVVVVGASVMFLHAKQARREMDERMAQHLQSNRCMEMMEMDTLATAHLGQFTRSIEKEESGSIRGRNIPAILPDQKDDIRVEVIETLELSDS